MSEKAIETMAPAAVEEGSAATGRSGIAGLLSAGGGCSALSRRPRAASCRLFWSASGSPAPG